MKYYKYILSMFCCLLIAACGNTSGGGGAEHTTSAGITLSADKIETTIGGDSQVITATIHCSSDDIFSKECVFHGVDVSWGDSHKITYTYNDVIKVGESKKYEILVFSASDKIHEPFSYLYNTNPSTSYTGWTTYEDVIGTLESAMIAVGSEVCVEDPPPPVVPPAVQTQSTTCTGVTSFSATLPDYTKGTLRITDGTQVLEEKSFGILSGNGSGYVVDNHADFIFNAAPSVGAFITAMYISPFKELSNTSVGNGMTVFYGNDQFTKEGNLIIDSMSQVMGNITGKEIIVTNPWGFRESAVTVRYDGEPFVSNGGETVGAGDGILKTFSLKTKYGPVYEDLMTVFTDTQQGELMLFDKNTGEFTVEFPQPPIAGEKIKTSYSLLNVTMPVTLSFNLNVNGTQERTVMLGVTR